MFYIYPLFRGRKEWYSLNLQAILKECYREIAVGSRLEKTLWFCQKLRDYSLANTLLLIKQSRGRVRFVQGAAEWSKRYGTSITANAIPFEIYAPLDRNGKSFSTIQVYDSDTEMGGQGPTFRPKVKTTILVNAFAKKAGIQLIVDPNQKEPLRYSASGNKVSLNVPQVSLTFHALKGIALINLERKRKKGMFQGELAKATAIACAYAFEVRCFLQEIEETSIPEAARKIILKDIKGCLNESHNMARKTMDAIEKIQLASV